jgi:hypothetical protein
MQASSYVMRSFSSLFDFAKTTDSSSPTPWQVPSRFPSVSRASVDLTTTTAAVTLDATTRTLDDDQQIPVQAATIIMYDNTLPDTRKAHDVIEPEAITATARNIDDTEALDQDLAKRSTANKHEK